MKNNTKSTRQQIVNYAKACYAGLYIVSHEETRVEAEVKAAADELGYNLAWWTCTAGITMIENGEAKSIPDTEDPVGMAATFATLPERTLLVAKDLHPFLDNPILVRRIKDGVAIGRATQKVIVLCGCTVKLAPEIEKVITPMEFQLPGREELREVLAGAYQSADLGPLKQAMKDADVDAVLDAACGMTTTEAEDAFALSIVEAGSVTREIVYREKTTAVRKNGILELVETPTSLADVGGLENLKDDLNAKRNSFTKAARDYGLPSPRGMLVVGQPGTGKSLTAKATASVFNIPLLRLEAGRLFGSLVGQSEENWRKAHATARAMAPCILWVDEVDGLFAGHGGASTDSGTTQRVLKNILADMQENSDGIFYFFTANDVDNLPDPLIDRLDVWSVDLPSRAERKEIVRIHVQKRGRDPKKLKLDLDRLASLTDGFSGRQIEQVWLKAMTVAFNEDGREPTHDDFANVAATFTPTSKLMAEQIERRRRRLQNRATPASKPETTPSNGGRKITK